MSSNAPVTGMGARQVLTFVLGKERYRLDMLADSTNITRQAREA